MAEDVYAIVRNPNDETLSLQTFPAKLERTLSDNEIWRPIAYATDLSSAFSSVIPPATKEERDNKNERLIQYRKDAIAFCDTVKKVAAKKGVVAYSHRYGGWRVQPWTYNEDIKFKILTNFGYGSASYFCACYLYKDVVLAPYCHYIKYRDVDAQQIIGFTYIYSVNYSCWQIVMEDTISFYNTVTQRQENLIFEWMEEHLRQLTYGLRELLVSTSFPIYNCNTYRSNNRDKIKQISIKDDELIRLKAEKISRAVIFIKNIKLLPAEVSPEQYIERLNKIFKDFFLWAEEQHVKLSKELEELQKQEEEILAHPLVIRYNNLLNNLAYTDLTLIKSWHSGWIKIQIIRGWLKLRDKRRPKLSTEGIRELITRFSQIKEQVKITNVLEEGILRIWLVKWRGKLSEQIINDIRSLVDQLNNLRKNESRQHNIRSLLNCLEDAKERVDGYLKTVEEID